MDLFKDDDKGLDFKGKVIFFFAIGWPYLLIIFTFLVLALLAWFGVIPLEK